MCIRDRIYEIDDWAQGLLNGILMFVNLIVLVVITYRFIRVQGLFLCESYGPAIGVAAMTSLYQFFGWRPGPEADGKELEPEENVLLTVVNLNKQPTFQEQTFKCVS
eukprot:TRINITY_DN5174_c0_g1_i1.p1 TRINITY_DN5174_c0_g1~~TRINITY_DN5174_c0_g1_i1.p1  ORF type:complete len:107 (+),score=23.94 TRINITY_DN5174_c0_g1_i1:120-440(+)